METGVEYGVVVLLAVAVAATELVGRYRDSPRRLVRLVAFWGYLGVNALASVTALALARANGWTLGGSDIEDTNLTRTLAAGFAGLAVLRSGFAVIRVGDRDVPAGPGALVSGLLATAERTIDRAQARDRSHAVGKLMTGVSFDRAYKVLPKHCLLLLRNATPEETRTLAAAVAEIAEDVSSSDQAKAYNLGVALINFAGPDVLEGAVRTLGGEITGAAPVVQAEPRDHDMELYVVE